MQVDNARKIEIYNIAFFVMRLSTSECVESTIELQTSGIRHLTIPVYGKTIYLSVRNGLTREADSRG